MPNEKAVQGDYGTAICPKCNSAVKTSDYPKHVSAHVTEMVNTSPGALNTVRANDVVYQRQPQYDGPSSKSKPKTGT